MIEIIDNQVFFPPQYNCVEDALNQIYSDFACKIVDKITEYEIKQRLDHINKQFNTNIKVTIDYNLIIFYSEIK